MITFIPPALTGPAWKTVELGSDSIEIAVRKPTLNEQLAALDAGVSSHREFMLRSHIVDWRGVQDPKGQPVPFSWDMLNQLGATYPAAAFELVRAVREVLDAETDPKNLPLPLPVGGTATNEGTTSSMESLDCISTANASADCAPLLA